MKRAISFQTRARAIDHLGREQIADVPTAISELWKNSFDAYARKAEVHLFDDNNEYGVATIIDDGHGMTLTDITERWLVIGTESKFIGSEESADDSVDDRNGLAKRPKQGQKGIGRLSSAMLGPLLLLVSKKKYDRFVALLIDWRLFQNPYLLLDDITIPVQEFDAKEQLFEILPEMFDQLMGNVWGDPAEKESSRNKRLTSAWDDFTALELSQGKTTFETTQALITDTIINSAFKERHIEPWDVWINKSESGTALLISGIHEDLKAQYGDVDDPSVDRARKSFFSTLIAFTNPVSSQASTNFDYRVTVHRGQYRQDIIAPEHEFSTSDWEKMEHRVIGEIDEDGVFEGNVTAFGDDLGHVSIPLQVKMPKHQNSKVGKIHIQLGSYEVSSGTEGLGGKNTSMEPSIWADIDGKLEKYCGLKVYRDGLRVMPYGKAENDFFEIEQRRSKNAGLYHYSLRNMIGAISLDGTNNKNLRDKAGREGFIENKASKAFREVVSRLLIELAKRYYGRDKKSLRHEYLPELTASYNERKAQDDLKKAQQRQKRNFNRNLNKAAPQVKILKEKTSALIGQLQSLTDETFNIEDIILLQSQVESMQLELRDLKVSYPPRTLTSSSEKTFRSYRDDYSFTLDKLGEASKSIQDIIIKLKPRSPDEISKGKIGRFRQIMSKQLKSWESEACELLGNEKTRILDMVSTKRNDFILITDSIFHDIQNERVSLSHGLGLIDEAFEKAQKENEEIFPHYLNTLQSLSEHIDLTGLANYTIDRASALQEEVDRLNALAQLGITVEIIGHELNALQADANRSLSQVENQIVDKSSAEDLRHAYGALVDRLKFLSPLKLSGEAVRDWISGGEIEAYCTQFFGERLNWVKFTVSEEFRSIRLYDQKSKIFPVFVNLLNNSLYWVKQADQAEPEIKLDVVGDHVVVSDNGTGVYSDDIKDLFTLFFTKRTNGGRGVGLYLCRRNLASSGHKIFYGVDKQFELLSGANFVIEFKGIKHG